jgi:polysaccharide export outer membrane protein
MKLRVLCALLLAAPLSACFNPSADLPRGRDAYAMIPSATGSESLEDYRIGARDVISIRVFQEPELTFDQLQVDAGGSINFPLVGQLAAAGKTPFELSNDIAAGLGERFIRSPQVVVGVVQSVGSRVVVEGQVTNPGVFEIAGSSTLLESLARAQGPTNVAALDEIVVFRNLDGQRMGAVFDLNDIREGKADDPQILGGDRIVVGFSGLKGVYQDFLKAAPLINVFTRF